ncbi:MAG: hypothetical protein ACXQS8_00830 [Candidatus Helarchaeales archaeon]
MKIIIWQDIRPNPFSMLIVVIGLLLVRNNFGLLKRISYFKCNLKFNQKKKVLLQIQN